MPRMTKRWRNAAFVLAFLGFISWFRYIGQTDDPGAVLVTAALNAVIWFGVVYVVFLVVRAIRR